MVELQLSNPQYVYLNELDTQYRAYVGGFGSGKTYVGCLDLLLFALKHPGVPQGYFGPTYPSIRDIFWPVIEEAGETLGITVDVHRGDKEVGLYKGGRELGRIICRSMDRPNSIIGFKIARALVDEIDTMNLDKAMQAWNKIIARMRLVIPGVKNSVGITCTPEGFNFVYAKFKKEPTPRYSMVQASTYENAEYLPEDYIPSLYESYPSQLVDAYIKGQFVNLTSGAVYYAFDRYRCNSDIIENDRDPLHIGMDFNVYNMAAIIHVRRGNEWIAVREFVNLRDTPDMISVIRENYPNRRTVVYPDASGRGTSSKSCTVSDIVLLKQAGFVIKAKDANPRVKNRVASLNNQLEKGLYKVNVDRCKDYAEALEQQIYNPVTNMPDKESGLDHKTDAGGYFNYFLNPIEKPSFKIGRAT